jgi:hypothetical protein
MRNAHFSTRKSSLLSFLFFALPLFSSRFILYLQTLIVNEIKYEAKRLENVSMKKKKRIINLAEEKSFFKANE